MLGGSCSQIVMGNTSRLNQLQSALIFKSEGSSTLQQYPHYNDVTSLTIVYSTVYSDADQRKH